MSVYSLSGTLIRNHDVDAGMRLMLAAPSGQLLQAWDDTEWRAYATHTAEHISAVACRCGGVVLLECAPRRLADAFLHPVHPLRG